MSDLLYIHGFLSSPVSHKAVQVKNWLSEHRPYIRYHCPFLTPYAGQTRKTLESIVENILPSPVYLMGSSLGGYWATWLAEKYDLRAVLINPAVKPEMFKNEFINVELQNYHTQDKYQLSEKDGMDLMAVNINQVKRTANYWLMVQTGDETLDYKLAVEKYSASKQLIEEGGDHSFQNFERHIESAIDFLSSDKKANT